MPGVGQRVDRGKYDYRIHVGLVSCQVESILPLSLSLLSSCTKANLVECWRTLVPSPLLASRKNLASCIYAETVYM